jgi:hypothetical protein
MNDDHVHLNLVPLVGEPFDIRWADELAEFFFRADLSSSGKDAYDKWILSDPYPCRITEGDITAVNTTMGARTSAKHWGGLTEAVSDENWLCALDPSWDLFAMPEMEWLEHVVDAHLGECFEAVMGSYRGAAVTTKVLHIKRPRLIPVCDSYVARTMGVELWDSGDWRGLLSLVLHLRKQGQENLEALQAIQTRLSRAGMERTLVRILDALLWMKASDTGPYHVFAEWLERAHG